METNIKQRIAAGALALSLLGGSGVGVAAQGNGNQTGGAAGLVAAVVQLQEVTGVQVQVVDSFNNLRALNNVLNNSPILSQNDIDVLTVGDVNVNVTDNTITVAGNTINVTVFGITLADIIDDIVAIVVVDDTDVVIVV